MTKFRVPTMLASDCRAQFTSNFWSGLCRLLVVDHNTTTAYRSQGNRLVVCFHHGMKESLHARLAIPDWLLHLLGSCWAWGQPYMRTLLLHQLSTLWVRLFSFLVSSSILLVYCWILTVTWPVCCHFQHATTSRHRNEVSPHWIWLSLCSWLTTNCSN